MHRAGRHADSDRWARSDEHRRQRLGQVLGDQARRPNGRAGLAVQPDRGRRRASKAGHRPGRAARRSMPARTSPCPGGGEIGRGVVGDGGAAVGCGDDGVGALQDDDRAGPAAACARAVELRRQRRPGRGTGGRTRPHAGSARPAPGACGSGAKRRVRIVGERRQRVGVEHDGRRRGERRLDQRRAYPADAEAGPSTTALRRRSRQDLGRARRPVHRQRA